MGTRRVLYFHLNPMFIANNTFVLYLNPPAPSFTQEVLLMVNKRTTRLDDKQNAFIKSLH